jgi:hypothetical protein
MAPKKQSALQKIKHKIELMNFNYNRRFLQSMFEYRVAFNNAPIGERVRERKLNSRRLDNILQ